MSEFERDRDYLTRLLKLKASDVPKEDTSFFEKPYNKTMSGDDYTKKIERLKALKKGGKMAGKMASRGLKAFPLIGGIMAGLASGDASAAVPVLGEADDLGAPKDSLEGRFERGELTPEERMRFLKRMGEE
jgi:hypothetical protein